MELLIKASGIAIAAAVIGLVLKKNSPEVSLMLAIAAGCAVIYMSAGAISEIISFLSELVDYTGITGDVLSIVLKSVAVAIVTKAASDICKDAGHSATASSLELIGSATVLYIALPLFETVIQMINSLV